MNAKKIIYFLLGVIVTLLLFITFSKFNPLGKKEEESQTYLLKNQISQMNKMVVIEQDFSTLERTTVSYDFFGKTISDNKIVTLTKTNAQVSYDLNKMELKIDSINKKLIIAYLPEAKIRITPSVEIQSIDDSFFNRIDEKQIKKVTQSAKNNAIKKVDKEQLINKGNKQLMKNLNQIFVLAKALKYEIVDETHTIDKNEL